MKKYFAVQVSEAGQIPSLKEHDASRNHGGSFILISSMPSHGCGIGCDFFHIEFDVCAVFSRPRRLTQSDAGLGRRCNLSSEYALEHHSSTSSLR